MSTLRSFKNILKLIILCECGNYTCGNRSYTKPCYFKVLDKQYKFYLSFENAICEGYVTEKLHKITIYPISTIPVVLWGTNYSHDYPQKNNYRRCGHFITKTSCRFYQQYRSKWRPFEWVHTEKKNALTCRRNTRESFFCRLCEYLHRNRRSKQFAPDVTKFWSAEKRCSHPRNVIHWVNFSWSENTLDDAF